MDTETCPVCAEVVIDVPVGGRVLVAANLSLTAEPDPASVAVTDELAQTIDAWDGPGVVVIAGNLLDLLTSPTSTPAGALAAHGRLAAALRRFRAAPSRRVVCLPGLRDSSLAWDEDARRQLVGALDAEVALAAELRLATGRGERRVRIEPGYRFDSRNAFVDVCNPTDTPLGQHLLRDVLPSLGPARTTWLAGADRLADDGAFPRFMASRFLYRRLGRWAWLLLVPLVLAVGFKVPLTYALTDRAERALGPWTNRAFYVGMATAVDVLVLALVVMILTRRAWSALSGVQPGRPALGANDRARAEARCLVNTGAAGLITGHTRQAELAALGTGFYANCGAAAEVVVERRGRFGLPPAFVSKRELSWVELEAGADLHVRLLHAAADTTGARWLERALTHRAGEERRVLAPRVVSSLPGGEDWPPVEEDAVRLTRQRRRAAALIALAGLLDLASAITPPLRERLHLVLKVVPLAVPQVATALVALSGLALLLLARGVRRGQRRAWQVSMALLLGSAVLHVVKGVDLEEGVVALVVAGYLFASRRAFRASVDPSPAARRLLTLAAVAATAVVVGTTAVLVGSGAGRPPLWHAVGAVSERLVGVRTLVLGDRLDDFLTPALLAVGVGVLVSAWSLLFRPVVRRHSGGATLARARDTVARYGHSTLDYFALRSDKEHFFHLDTVVAYAVYGGVCLVSPDPIGPEAERDEVWAVFRRFVDEHGWTLAVLGAGEDWLPIYRSSGMHDLYVGDEAVVDAATFTLDGGRHKSLRQAVNRIAKYGYTMSFHDPAALEPGLEAELREVLARSRRGDVERGFSMTLGRVFDRNDRGLLLAVCRGPDGRAVAFCQYVPALGIDGYSLDLMRREPEGHPNGLLDFVVVETIRQLPALGLRRLGLNFATMRAVLAGDAGVGVVTRVERWALRHMSGSMQIESLWRFNAKFDPEWLPRYAVYDSPEHIVPVAFAIARAESFWELPLVGRFLVPTGGTPTAPAEPPPAVPAPAATTATPAANEELTSTR